MLFEVGQFVSWKSLNLVCRIREIDTSPSGYRRFWLVDMAGYNHIAFDGELSELTEEQKHEYRLAIALGG